MLHVTDGRSKIVIVSLQEGIPAGEESWIRVTGEAVWSDKPRWSPDGNLIYYLSDTEGHRGIWAQHLDAANKKPVGDPMSVLHSYELPFSIGPAGSAFAEMDVSEDRIWFNIAESSGNIWSFVSR